MNRKNPCGGCKHYKPLGCAGRRSQHACHYSLDTGRCRLEPVDKCSHYRRASRKEGEGKHEQIQE